MILAINQRQQQKHSVYKEDREINDENLSAKENRRRPRNTHAKDSEI